jgi:hypothetical protein
VRPHDLIACPTCHARMDELCRTSGGYTRRPHTNRLVRKVCPCGATLGYHKGLCEPCLRRNLRYRKRIQQRRRLARRRAARLVVAA